jgi:hypothetical protein
MNNPRQLRGRRLMEVLAKARPASLDSTPAASDTIAARLAAAGIPRPAGLMRETTPRAPVPPPRRLPTVLAGAGLAVTAAVAAVAIAVTATGGGTPVPGGTVTLTAAKVQQMADASHSALARSVHAVVSFRVVTAGVPQAYGTSNVTISGKSWNRAYSDTTLAAGPAAARTESTIERFVNGQDYMWAMVRGRRQWIQHPLPLPLRPEQTNLRDPRLLLGLLEPSAQFQVTGYQTIGGVRLKVLRATDPGRLPHSRALPSIFTSGQPVTSLQLWVDQQQVVHRMAVAFRAPGAIQLSTPTSKAALQAYLRAKRTDERLARQHGKHILERLHAADLRLYQLEGRAYQVRRGAQVTTATVIFLDIGQPQHITAPAHAIPYCVFLDETATNPHVHC